MSNSGLVIPSENLDTYIVLYHIEVGLRELIIESIESTCGPHGWKNRLPPDVLDCCRKGHAYEQSTKWSQLIPHHPIYYVDFPDLKKIVERADNWQDIFQPIFKRKDILTSTLSEVEPIRNRIAHNRKATHGHLLIAKAAYQKISTAIGEARFGLLVSKCSLALDLPATIVHLQEEAEIGYKCCLTCASLGQLKVWTEAKDKWWFDDDYLGCNLDSIQEYFSLLEAYSELPRYSGSGHEIEAWVKSKSLNEKYDRAKEQLSNLLDSVGV